MDHTLNVDIAEAEDANTGHRRDWEGESPHAVSSYSTI